MACHYGVGKKGGPTQVGPLSVDFKHSVKLAFILLLLIVDHSTINATAQCVAMRKAKQTIRKFLCLIQDTMQINV
jgi:hypothetical protein